MLKSTAAQQLAEFAHALRPKAIPTDVRALAWSCLTDAVGCAAFGAQFSWSRMIIEQAAAGAAPGSCHLPTLSLPGLPVEQAALIAGACAHAFELDSLRKPGAGVHPGATVALPALMVAQDIGAGLEDLLCAIVAGTEVMFRIGNATLHSAEQRGFHAPGITGPFGAAVATGLLRGLSLQQMVDAFGIAGSMSGGLLAFSHAGGGMVKRLHMGRAAQGGVFAANLAARGYEGPNTVLEGKFGLLEAYCQNSEPARLTAGLGTDWQTRQLCLKRYACHVTAQAPVECLREMMSAHDFSAEDISTIDLAVSDKVLSHHSNPAPTDLAGAQYSVPYVLAVAALNNPDDPKTFIKALDQPAAAELAARITLHSAAADQDKWGATLAVRLVSGRVFDASKNSFLGTPERPFTSNDMASKFASLTGRNFDTGCPKETAKWLAPRVPDSPVGRT